MPRLIVLNGLAATGKSTLAKRYADEHPLTLNLDVDRVRSLIGRWHDDPGSAGLLARAIALAAARVHLSAGHDVVVPQFVGRPGFLEQLEELASDVGADFHEVVLVDSLENVQRRFAARDNASLDIRVVGPDELAAMHDRLMAHLETRPRARTVRTQEGEVERSYRDFLGTVAP